MEGRCRRVWALAIKQCALRRVSRTDANTDSSLATALCVAAAFASFSPRHFEDLDKLDRTTCSSEGTPCSKSTARQSRLCTLRSSRHCLLQLFRPRASALSLRPCKGPRYLVYAATKDGVGERGSRNWSRKPRENVGASFDDATRLQIQLLFPFGYTTLIIKF